MSVSNIIQYYRDCYRADNREQVIYDFLDRKIEDKICFEGKEELITGEYPFVPIENGKADKITKKLTIFSKEKELLYATFFICGDYTDFRGETKRLCAPLFYYPAEIMVKDDLSYVKINDTDRRINYPLISMLTKDSDDNIHNDNLFKNLPKDLIRFEDINLITEVIKKYFTDVDFSNIYSYPQNESIAELKREATKAAKSNGLSLIPSSILGIVEKSSNTRGVINELTELADTPDLSTPLLSLLSDDSKSSNKTYKKGNLPLILSHAQQAILKSASINPLTLIVGPPGTGKTYTISAIALEHLSRGKSVLIASRTDEAVDVIATKVFEQTGISRCVVRTGKKRSYATPLRRFLKSIITRSYKLRYLLKEFDLTKNIKDNNLNRIIEQLSDDIDKQCSTINKIETDLIKESENEIKWGKHLSREDESFLDRLKTKYLNIRNRIQTPLWEHNSMLHRNDKELSESILKLIRLKYVSRIYSVLNNNWKDIMMFREALMLNSDTERLKKLNDINFNAVLRAFPIWLTNLSEVKDSIPFKKEMFDVVIIDEATQCDIASCLPLIQRGKRVVFAGDPCQLRHVSFLSKGIQSMLKQKYSLENTDDSMLNYRDRSILDLAITRLKSGDQVAMLDEHFRSIEPIINFSNKQFYDGGLRVMTSRPDLKERGIYTINCNGERDKKGVNTTEADMLMLNIRKQVDEEKDVNDSLCTSIGVLSPFRNQVDILIKKLTDNFTTEEIERHKIRIGTAYAFQGEERDIMHISFAVDNNSHHSAFIHLNKEDVFNVSITRARLKQFIYISVSKNNLKPESLLRKYLESTEQYNKKYIPDNSTQDTFLNEVKELINKWEINSYWSDFTIANLKIDLLVKHNNNYIGIDLVGYPGEYEDIFGIERYRILNRAGIKIFPLPYSDWYFAKENTQNTLKRFIIEPDKIYNN
ncbi:MAG: DNA2/NAM7 family helicase [Bacteroidales bacterium]|jgi:superfamily I DNA and/or RNA helicase|nr:DNA2/NAM7 family helicase [Bacteroidales bacterium]